MNSPLPIGALALSLAVVTSATAAAGLKVKERGYAGVQSRAFADDGDPTTTDYGLSAVSELQISLTARPFKARLRAFALADSADRNRDTIIVEEAWVELKKNPLRLRLGVQVHNWTATEAFHPADVLNSRYFDSDIENPQKIGEPTASAILRLPIGVLAGHIMPFVINPIAPSARSRQNFLPRGFTLGRPLRLTRGDSFGGQRQFQWAVRFSGTIESLAMDLSLHALQHQDRQRPLVIFDQRSRKFRPLYLPLTQTGGTMRMVVGDFVIKAEAVYRWVHLPPPTLVRPLPPGLRDHGVAAVGVDWGLSFANGIELTFLAEAQAVLLPERQRARRIEPFQADLLLGMRFVFNDSASRELLLSGIVDLEYADEGLLNITFSQRLGETFKLKVGARIILAPPRSADPQAAPAAGLAALTDADQIHLSLVRYF